MFNAVYLCKCCSCSCVCVMFVSFSVMFVVGGCDLTKLTFQTQLHVQFYKNCICNCLLLCLVVLGMLGVHTAASSMLSSNNTFDVALGPIPLGMIHMHLCASFAFGLLLDHVVKYMCVCVFLVSCMIVHQCMVCWKCVCCIYTYIHIRTGRTLRATAKVFKQLRCVVL